ncbi:MAG: J domain-containing protein [Rectinemataceae bacterium]|nr:J domain-containing protein [Rectinemataceae bacterium]
MPRTVPPSRRKPYGYYSILGISPGTGKEHILRAWRKLALQHHPDKYPSPQAKAAATKRMKLLNEAKDVLLNDDLRDSYDELHNWIVPSTIRVREHRRSLSRFDKHVVSAITVGRRWVKRCKKGIPKKKMSRGKKVGARTPNCSSRLLQPTDKWVLIRRKKSERKKDKRLSCVQAVPNSKF